MWGWMGVDWVADLGRVGENRREDLPRPLTLSGRA